MTSVRYPSIEETVFRAKYEQGNRTNQVLAGAIFTKDLKESRHRLVQDIFSPFIDTQLFLAILMRPQNDTSVDYVRSVAQQVVNGQVRKMNLKSMRAHIMNKDAVSLKVHLSQRTAYTVGDQQREKEQLEKWSQIYAKIQRNEPIPEEILGGTKETVEEEEEENGGESQQTTLDLPWLPNFGLPNLEKFESYSWFCTVWVRVNASLLLFRAYSKKHVRDKFFEAKVKTFQNAHLPVIRYLDSLEDPRDENVDANMIVKLYGEGAGLSYYHCDKRFFQVVRTQFKHKATPLEVIRARYGDLKWTPEEKQGVTTYWIDDEWNPLGPGVPDPSTHKLYYGVLSVLNQCRSCMDSIRQYGPSEMFDNLWLYYVSWVDLFDFCLSQPERRMDDAYLIHPLGTRLARDGRTLELTERASPWELYGTMDTRAFHAGDLPNLFHVLQSIPLWGEHNTPPFALAKLYQKSLPFACQRRHIIPAVIKNIQQKPVFWRFFSKLTWVMLAGLYPGKLAALQTCIGMRELLRVKELCSNKELLCRVLSVHQPKCDKNVADKPGSKNGGPLIVWTIFRNHIVYMASHNPSYVRDFARHYVDWDYFEKDVIKLSHIIRSFDLFSDDPFAQARMQLSKTIKSPNAIVHRLRRKSLALSLVEHANETLEKVVLSTVQMYRKDLQVMTQTPEKLLTGTFIGQSLTSHECFKQVLAQCMDVTKRGLVRYENALALRCKCNILNELIRLPPEERLRKPALSMMMDPAYGGILPSCLDLICELVNVYNQKSLPACYRDRIDKMSMANFTVFCYYVNIVAVLDKISFVPLDADTVKRTDFAMMHKKHHIPPGDALLPSVYDICIAICCEKICTVMNKPGAFGAKKISYDLERDTFVCSRGKHLNHKEEDDDEDEEDEDDDCEDLDVAQWMEKNAAATQDDEDTDIFQHPEKVIIHDLTSDAATMKGKGSKRTEATEERKELRSQRRALSKIPCGQPVLRFNLRGRALIWGNTLAGRIQIMFCPNCATLHTYTLLLFSASTGYRCLECARQEILHKEPKACAFCDKVTESQFTENTQIDVFCPVTDPKNNKFDPINEPESCIQTVNLCKTHYSYAKKFIYTRGTMPKKELWTLIRKEEERKQMERAKGNYKK